MNQGANIIRLSDVKILPDGSTFKARPNPEDKPSKSLEKEIKDRKSRLQQAVIYGKAALQDSSKKNVYLAGDKEKAFDVAFADFLNAPSIDAIDLSAYTGRIGSQIFITVVDDFAVVSVYVKIQNSDGSIADEGYAEPGLFKTEWTFSASQDNPILKGDKITVTASDIPGNDAAMERML